MSITNADEQISKLFLDSTSRIVGLDSGDCVIDIGNTYNNVKSIVFNRVSMPLSWYTIVDSGTRQNNTFTISRNGVDSVAPIVLDPGYKTAAQIAADLQTKIRAAFPEWVGKFLVTYNADLNIYEFSTGTAVDATDVFVLRFSVNPDITPARILGFFHGVDSEAATQPGGGGTSWLLASETWAQLYTRYITIRLGEISPKSWSNNTGSNTESVLIPVDENQGQIIQWTPSPYEGIINFTEGQILSRQLSVSFRDQYGRIIDFRRANWIMSISLIRGHTKVPQVTTPLAPYHDQGAGPPPPPQIGKIKFP